MSKLEEYRDAERALYENLQRLENLKNNTQLIKELEFEKRLMMLLKRYSKKTEDLLDFIRPVLVTGLETQEQRPSHRRDARKKCR